MKVFRDPVSNLRDDSKICHTPIAFGNVMPRGRDLGQPETSQAVEHLGDADVVFEFGSEDTHVSRLGNADPPELFDVAVRRLLREFTGCCSLPTTGVPKQSCMQHVLEATSRGNQLLCLKG